MVEQNFGQGRNITQKGFNCTLGQLCKGFIGGSKNGEGAFALQGLNQTSRAQGSSQGCKAAISHSNINDCHGLGFGLRFRGRHGGSGHRLRRRRSDRGRSSRRTGRQNEGQNNQYRKGNYRYLFHFNSPYIERSDFFQSSNCSMFMFVDIIYLYLSELSRYIWIF
jgi:hypothetical protein